MILRFIHRPLAVLVRDAKFAELIFFFWFAPEIEGKPKTTSPPGRFIISMIVNMLGILFHGCYKPNEAKLQVVFICPPLRGK